MDKFELMSQWQRGLGNTHRAHFEAAKHYERLHMCFGIPTVIMSALLGTTVFTSLQYSESAWVKTLMAVLSVAVVALTSLQTFFKYSERAERHKTAAVQIGEIRRELEQKMEFETIDEAFVKTIRKKWDTADRQSPPFPPGLYERVQEKRRRDFLRRKDGEASQAVVPSPNR